MATDYAQYRDYATPEQRQKIDTLIACGSQRAAAKKLGVNVRTFERGLEAAARRAASAGYSPEHGLTRPAAPGFKLRGHSDMVPRIDPETGERTIQWLKYDRDQEQAEAAMQAAADAYRDDLPREPLVKAPKGKAPELLNLYVITDYHIGMLAWPEETRDDEWDTAVAENMLAQWFGAAIKSAPDADIGVFAQLGDFLHWDGLDAVTPQSKHVLDADTRFQKLVRVAIRSSRRVIKALLAKHKRVHVIMAEGNHDESGSAWLREWMHEIYQDNPRVTVDLSPDPFYCVEHGKTSLFFHHGHKRKPTNIDHVFAAKFRELFGRTEHSYAHMGHMHHKDVTETNLMEVEQHRTLAAKDAYASRGGWMAKRSAPVITYHKQHGEVGRLTFTPEMVA